VFFNQLKQTAAFSSIAARQQLMDRLNAIPGVKIAADGLEKQPHIRLTALTTDHAAAFLAVMDWVIGKIRYNSDLAA
jgi:hypothetical protein